MLIKARETQSKWLQYLCNQLVLLVVVLKEQNIQMYRWTPSHQELLVQTSQEATEKWTSTGRTFYSSLCFQGASPTVLEKSHPQEILKRTNTITTGFIPQYRNQNIVVFFQQGKK